MLSCMLLEYQHGLRMRSSGRHACTRTHIANHFIIVVTIDHHLHNAVTVTDCCLLDTNLLLHPSFDLLDHPAEQPSDTHPATAALLSDQMMTCMPATFKPVHHQLRSACSLPSRTR
jgi:hypothetical protein